jgi:hypothetical protein
MRVQRVTWRQARSAGFAIALFVASLTIYHLTRAPGLTWAHRGADGGDFLAAAATLGVPHPPGYPTYTLLLHFLMQLPFKEPAAAGNVLSALAGAAAVALWGSAIRLVLDRSAQGGEERRWTWWAAGSGALAFGLMPLVWSQALITEVYTLHLALAAGVLWLLIRWRRTGRGLLWAAWLFGLGLTHHLTLLFIAPGALVLLIAGRRHLRWRTLLAAGGASLMGLAPYAYLPWAARRTPPVNWDDPRTWDGFKRVVLATRYRQNLFELTPGEVLARVGSWTRLASPILWVPLALLVLLGLVILLRRDRPIALLTGLYAVLSTVYAINYGTSDYWVNLLPVIMVVALWLATGLWWLIGRAARRWRWGGAAGRVVLAGLPLALLVTQWPAMDASDDHAAGDFVAEVLTTAEPDAIVFARGDERIFALWYAAYGLGQREDLIPILPIFLHWEWYQATLAHYYEGLDLRPEGLGGTALEVMIERHVDERPVYLTWEDEEVGKTYRLVQQGPLWRVLPGDPGGGPGQSRGDQAGEAGQTPVLSGRARLIRFDRRTAECREGRCG